MNILADATLPELQACFPPPFSVTLYDNPGEIAQLLPGKNILFCRSTLKVNEALLSGSTLNTVATASSGVDHVDTVFLDAQNIKLLDAKGSNASAVADYVDASLNFLLKNHALSLKTAGIIGFGAVGSEVARRLSERHFEIRWYDPFIKPVSVFKQASDLKEILESDLVCVHANLHDRKPFPSRNLLSLQELAQIRAGAVLINASRGGIVNEAALIQMDKAFFYCTDVFLSEPDINSVIVEKATLATPHIAGHTLEAKLRAVTQISEQLHALYDLPPPVFPEVALNSAALKTYCPFEETNRLKNADNKKEIFLKLRKEHLRHAAARAI